MEDRSDVRALTRFVREAVKDVVLSSRRLLEDASHRLAGTPVPPWKFRCQIGGNFWRVGVEYHDYLVELGGLKMSDRLLDIGCRAGRLAIPLSRYFREDGSYTGVDDWPAGNDWCRGNIGGPHRNFSFHQVAMLDNPGRSIQGETGPEALPFATGTFDFVVYGSINHLTPKVFDYYLKEAARVLVAGGTYFGTWYLQASSGSPRSGERGGLACTEEVAMARLRSLGLYVDAVYRGSWDGYAPSLSYQDVVIARKAL